MRNIIYLSNYIDKNDLHYRKNDNTYSQPQNNKVLCIYYALKLQDCNVHIISSGFVNGKSCKIYPKFHSQSNLDLVYASILDWPLVNSVYSGISIYKQIRNLKSKDKVDNIIFYNFKPETVIAAVLSKKILHIPITVEFEDRYRKHYMLSKFKQLIFDWTEKIGLRNIDSAILVSNDLAAYVNVPSCIVRGVVNENFLKYCNKNKTTINRNYFQVMYSGAINEEGGIKLLIESLKYTKSPVKLVITGKGDLSDFVRGVKDPRVEYKGYISYDEMKQIMLSSDILVNCQLTKHDIAASTFPSKVFEYISTGNRVVSSDISDIEEFAKGCFYFYHNDDPKELAAAIEKAVFDIQNNNTTFIDNYPLLIEKSSYNNIGKLILEVLER